MPLVREDGVVVLVGAVLLVGIRAGMVYHADVDAMVEQRQRLEATIGWARRLRASLQPILDAHGDRIHFRPGKSGISMVSLLADRPQRGRSRFCDLDALAADFEGTFARYCQDIEQGRPTGEKALQSFLIRESYAHARRLHAINVAAANTNDPVDRPWTSPS